MERHGKELADLGDAHPRRVPDFKNAWRKASTAQRVTLARWLISGEAPELPNEVIVELAKAGDLLFGAPDDPPACNCKAWDSQVPNLPHATDCDLHGVPA